jgi:hypothetical protein
VSKVKSLPEGRLYKNFRIAVGFSLNISLRLTYFPARIPWFFSGKINRNGRKRISFEPIAYWLYEYKNRFQELEYLVRIFLESRT